MSTGMDRRNLLRTAGVAALASAAIGGISGTPSAVAAELDVSGATTPQDFGAVGDGVADDTAAIQQALDAQLSKTNKIVYFPPGTYRITSTLAVPDRGRDVTPNFDRLVLAGAGTMGSRTSLIRVDFDGTALRLGAPLPAVRGLAFVVEPSMSSSVAVHTTRNSSLPNANTDDMDAVITECTFVDFGTAVKHVGRGLVFTNNLVAVGDVGLDISWPTGGVYGDNVHVLPYGMRKWLIEGNHFHSMNEAIVTTGADAHNFRGAVIANNILDIGRQLFVGGIINSTFAGNVVENGRTNLSVISITSGGSNLTFASNILGGAEPGGGNRPLHAIQFGTGSNPHHVTFTGNSFNWIDGSPIFFAGRAEDVTISANAFDNWNLDLDPRWGAIRIAGDAVGVSIIGNVLGENPLSDEPPIRVIERISASTIVGNIFDNVAGALYAGAIGGNNYIERRSAGPNAHEITSAVNGALVVRATTTGAYDVGADAYGSFLAASDQAAGAGAGTKGGMRVVPINDEGAAAVDLLVSTNSSNGIPAMRVSINGLVPTADDVRDLGSATNQMRTVYAHGLQLAPVTVGDLPAPSQGGIVMVSDPSTGAPVLAVSDGTSWYPMTPGEPIG
jgi:hypothetical protein